MRTWRMGFIVGSTLLAWAGTGWSESAADAPAARAVRAQAAVTRGLEWLRLNQATNGAWSNPQFPALTALPLWAICGASTASNRQAMADKATAYILSCVQTNGGIYIDQPGRKGGGLANYNTAICLTALHATGRRDLVPVILQARTFIAGSQHLGDDVYSGGFGYDRETKRAYTDLLNTHFAVEAMRRTQDVEDLRPAGQPHANVDWAATRRYVSKLQNPPAAGTNDVGGFFYNPDDPKAGTVTNAEGVIFLRSFGSITYAGLLALIYADVPRDDPRITSAVQFAASHWTLQENPGMGQQGLFFYFNVMSRALATAHVDTIPRPGSAPAIAWRDELIDRLIAMQQPDGAWSNANNRFWENDTVLATAYSLLALEYASGLSR